jgi:hypothetical protein
MRLNDFEILSRNLRVRAGFRVESKSLGGNTSATDSSLKGIKPKQLRVSMQVPFEQEDHLRELVAVAESTDDNGDLTVYTVTDPSAKAFGIKQVTFDGEFSAPAHGDLEAWWVTFSLKEYKSVAEQMDHRRDLAVVDPESSGATVAAAGDATGLEKVIADQNGVMV